MKLKNPMKKVPNKTRTLPTMTIHTDTRQSRVGTTAGSILETHFPDAERPLPIIL